MTRSQIAEAKRVDDAAYSAVAQLSVEDGVLPSELEEACRAAQQYAAQVRLLVWKYERQGWVV